MLSRIEYKVLYEINQLVIERDEHQKSNNPLRKDYDDKNIEIRLQDRFRKISKSKFQKTVSTLQTKNYIEKDSVYFHEFNLEQVAVTNDGMVALEDYKKDFCISLLKNALIPLLGSAFFSALFGWLFQLI